MEKQKTPNILQGFNYYSIVSSVVSTFTSDNMKNRIMDGLEVILIRQF